MRGLMLHELGEPENLSLEEISTPNPSPGEVLVDIHAAAVNFPDLLTIQGKYQVRPDLPFIPGKEGAGIVAAIGGGVTHVTPGDRVMVQVEYGTFAEQAVVPQHECYILPDAIPLDQAAALGIAFQTAYFALVDRARIKAGETVLVTGASGSVGIAAIQLAKVFGATVIAGLTTPSKEAVAREAGADHVIDLSGDNLKDAIRDRIFAVTDGAGVDVVIEIVGGEVFTGALRALKFRGRLVVVGFTSGIIPEMRTNYVLLKNIAVTGVDRGQYRDREPAWMHRAQDEIFRYCVEGKVRMPIQDSFALEDYIKAFDVIRNRQVRGKIILRIKEES
ncbi:MAG: NADPH:quinone oxidoreductase family protein [Proteobacteria bacterium]|nr:NADPH:quinone oxidoreductase family protein [Pseudomonadota bacterium]